MQVLHYTCKSIILLQCIQLTLDCFIFCIYYKDTYKYATVLLLEGTPPPPTRLLRSLTGSHRKQIPTVCPPRLAGMQFV